MALTFSEARACILREIPAGEPATERVPLSEAHGRVLAGELRADRDYPPFDRSARDGYAVRSAELPGRLRVIGEAKAGAPFAGVVGPGECVEIMTGAPMPAGADAVIMVEWTTRDGEYMVTERSVPAGDAFNPRGIEAAQGSLLLGRGTMLDFAKVGMLAACGVAEPLVYRRPRVAIVATGDELVAVTDKPGPCEIRNSNAYSLAAQVARAGGIPEILPAARDEWNSTWQMIDWGLRSDLLLLSGGVSAGKYDIVERVLEECGARFFFDRVQVQPGQPLVFGAAQERFFFGLPGNPVSAMVTFELFARAAVERLAGVAQPLLPLFEARLTAEFRHKPGLTRVLPALHDGGAVTPVAWKGSGDLTAAARSNCFLVADAGRAHWAAGEAIQVLAR